MMANEVPALRELRVKAAARAIVHAEIALRDGQPPYLVAEQASLSANFFAIAAGLAKSLIVD
jgi:hypothetical protein